MRDDEFNQKLAEVDDIIDRLNQGDIMLEEGERLKQRATELLDELEALLDQGEGKAVLVEMSEGEIVKEELRL